METQPRTWNGLWPSCQPHCSWQYGGWHHKHFIRGTSVIRLSAGKLSCPLWQLGYDEASINTFALFHPHMCVFLMWLLKYLDSLSVTNSFREIHFYASLFVFFKVTDGISGVLSLCSSLGCLLCIFHSQSPPPKKTLVCRGSVALI